MEKARLSLENLVRSDWLPLLLALAEGIPAFSPLLEDVIRIGVVVDAHIVQQELRWRLGRRQNPLARTKLHEAFASGVIIPFAPSFLRSDIADHLPDIAKATNRTIEEARAEWEDFASLLHFWSANRPSKLPGHRVADPDDLPYISAAEDLGLPVYSLDRHYQKMETPVIRVLIDGTAQAYARSSSMRIAVTIGSATTVMLGVEAIIALCRGISRLVGAFQRLDPMIQLAIVTAVSVAVLHPKSRAKLISAYKWLRTKGGSPVLQAIGNIALQRAESSEFENVARESLRKSLPPLPRRSALMHARTICLSAKKPLRLEDIETKMIKDGYVTRAQEFRKYLRRVLLTSGQFREQPSGLWTIID